MNVSTLLVLAAAVAVAGIAWRRGARIVAVAFGAFAVLPAVTLVRQASWWLLALPAGMLALVLWQRWGRTAATVTRWGARSRRKAGVASGLDIARVGSAVAMRRKAATVRPSLATSTRRARWAQLLRLPAAQVAVQLCRVGPVRVWASVEDVIVAFGGPRVGKTQWLAGRVLDAPGAVLVTSTRTDLLAQTGPLRAARGPVYVFNPVGLGSLASTITFDPLTGCCDPVTAAERATDMLAAANRGGSDDRQFWDDQGRRNLAALLHAAALGGLTMTAVAEWLSNLDAAQAQVTSLLRNKSPEPAFVAAITQFITTNDRTRTSITSTMAPALGWLTHGPARASARPGHGTGFDVVELLESGATVYLLGGEEAAVAPLVCALTGHVAREARRLAAHRPGGRLDPPLTLALDEAALICPVPLHQWTADMGGRGVTIVANFQSRAQMVDRYGDAKAAVILNNAGGRVLFGGTADRDDLTYWSTLAGDRDEPITTTDLNGRVASRTVRRVPVLSPAQLANLPAGRVVVYRRGMPPVVGWAEQAWCRADVRAYHLPDLWLVRARALVVRVAAHLAMWAGRDVAQLAALDVWALAPVRRWLAPLAHRVAEARATIGRRLRRAGPRPDCVADDPWSWMEPVPPRVIDADPFLALDAADPSRSGGAS